MTFREFFHSEKVVSAHLVTTISVFQNVLLSECSLGVFVKKHLPVGVFLGKRCRCFLFCGDWCICQETPTGRSFLGEEIGLGACSLAATVYWCVQHAGFSLKRGSVVQRHTEICNNDVINNALLHAQNNVHWRGVVHYIVCAHIVD